MKLELILKFEFEASHSLGGYETPHPHIFKLETSISGKPINGWLIDLVILNRRIGLLTRDLHKTFLNENEKANQMVRDFPTCESLAPFFYERLSGIIKHEFLSQNPSLGLSYVQVSICEMD